MGSPESEPNRKADEERHQVTLTRGFLMGKYPVTRVQWEAVMRGKLSEFRDLQGSVPVEQLPRIHYEVEYTGARGRISTADRGRVGVCVPCRNGGGEVWGLGGDRLVPG